MRGIQVSSPEYLKNNAIVLGSPPDVDGNLRVNSHMCKWSEEFVLSLYRGNSFFKFVPFFLPSFLAAFILQWGCVCVGGGVMFKLFLKSNGKCREEKISVTVAYIFFNNNSKINVHPSLLEDLEILCKSHSHMSVGVWPALWRNRAFQLLQNQKIFRMEHLSERSHKQAFVLNFPP